MKLLEYEAKALLRQFSVPVPDGEVIEDANRTPLRVPCVLKSQVPIGGRGKLGGVRIAQTPEEAHAIADDLFARPIAGFTPSKLLAEEVLAIDRELYLSLAIDRSAKAIICMAHPNGGVEVESIEAGDFFRQPLAHQTVTPVGDALADYLELPSKSFVIQDLLEKLLDCFISSDATLLEINPLILTKQGELVAGDCKIELDGAAAFRHPGWRFEAKAPDTNFVTLDKKGTIASIANGAGLAMATVDAIVARGFTPANFLDIGGTATHNHIVDALRTLASLPNVHAIVVNIFGGIVQCDVVAQAIIEAREARGDDFPNLLIRLSGNHSAEAAKLLEQHHLTLFPDLASCLQELHA